MTINVIDTDMRKIVPLVLISAVLLQFVPLLYSRSSYLVIERYGFPFVFFEKEWLEGGKELGAKEIFNIGYLFYDLGILFLVLAITVFIFSNKKNNKGSSI